ncbi:MBL fold metallo-hydrolase [Parasulfuritortus cantonensis]|uniref:MBL fold metallo-hydrolase n=1 Tax=Parasulfuritortus cantonensis TaxID=2528202 RepID=A0A4V2NV23_9PROT|nr:MBL fold metallo-hydrolase [Parasulfuritortus cantonensis]TCJ11826.1 MBL fold metallo-hydrolase [Parasulfuritortus cantonensis]
MRLTVHGAAREVTGSCYLVESGKVRFLVDCGMFQGGREAEPKNRRFPDFDPEGIDFVLVTHAHIDHSGLLPRLINLGFRGPVYCTDATADLLGVLLPDSAHIAEKEAEWRNYDRRRKRGELKGETAPIYTVEQARRSLKHLRRREYDQAFEPADGVRACFRDAGHILGSSIIELWLRGRGKEVKLVFSGDLGMPDRPLMNDPTPIAEADYLLVESTYGDRLHKRMDETVEELVFAVNDTVQRKKGNVIIPSFAVGRTQEIVYLLLDLIRRGRISGSLAIFVDSPMAAAATEITLRHADLLDEETRQLLDWQRQNGDHLPYIRFTESPEESMAINNIRQGAVIISASGMCDAGRIKHHLKNNLARADCSVIIAGFQAQGTLGRRLVDGAPYVRLFGEPVPVRASVYTLGGLSAHADRDALLGWLAGFRTPPRRAFVVHGEAATAAGFAAAVRDRFGWQVETPERGAGFDLV